MSEALVVHPNGGPFLTSTQWLLQLLNDVAARLHLGRRSLSGSDLIRAAQRRTGLTDFGEWAIEEPLDALIRSYEEDATLHAFGRATARWDLLRLLSNLLKFQEEEKRNPAILAEKIEQPIFITGMPRSGTTFLHELMCEDRSNLAVRCWETIYPFPMGDRTTNDIERRIKKVDRQFAAFTRIAPEIRSLHPLAAGSPQECSEITAHVLRSLRFDATHFLPGYRSWLDGQSQLMPYRFHKRFLQHLQYGRNGVRWVLKCPDHTFALDALRAVYPDARIVFMHRNPLSVLPSVCRLTETLRRPFTTVLDRRRLGADLSEQWGSGAAILVRTRESLLGISDPPLHLAFAEFVRDPAACVEAIYRHFGLRLDAEFVARLRALVRRKPKGGNGHNPGRLEDYGLDAETERRRFADYIDLFGLGT